MIRSRIAWTSALLAGLTGCTSAQHRAQMSVLNRPAAAEAQAEPPATGMARFFPNFTAREAAAKPEVKPAPQPAATRALAAKTAADPPKAEKKVFAPLARIEARWATRVKNARAAAAQMSASAATPTPTTAFLKKGPEPATLPRSIAVAVYPDEPASTTRPPSNPNPPAADSPAADPTAEADAGLRDADARRAQAESPDTVAEPSPTPAIAPESPEPATPKPAPPIAPESPEPATHEPAPTTGSSDKPEGTEAALSQFAAPEPPHLPTTNPAVIPASLAGRPRLTTLIAAHRPHVPSPAQPARPPDPPTSVKLPPLGLPADLPPPMFLRSYYGLDPAPKPNPSAPVMPAPTPRPDPRTEAAKPSWLERIGMFLAEQTGGR